MLLFNLSVDLLTSVVLWLDFFLFFAHVELFSVDSKAVKELKVGHLA